MQSQRVTTLADDFPRRADRGADLRVVPAAQPRRLLRILAAATAVLVAVGGYVHLCLYRHGYSMIPKIGVGFLLQVVTSTIVAIALLAGPHLVSRIAHLGDHMAGTLTALAAAGLAGGTLLAFAVTRTPGGLFNFQERGLQPAPQALIALVAEIGVLVAASALLLADYVLRRKLRMARPTLV